MVVALGLHWFYSLKRKEENKQKKGTGKNCDTFSVPPKSIIRLKLRDLKFSIH